MQVPEVIERTRRRKAAMECIKTHRAGLNEVIDDIIIHASHGDFEAAVSCIEPLKMEVARIAAFLYMGQAIELGFQWRDEENGKAESSNPD